MVIKSLLILFFRLPWVNGKEILYSKFNQSNTLLYFLKINRLFLNRYACKAYCTARQELAILLTLRHANIVPLVGLCTEPLALVLELAPLGSLDSNLKNYRRSGAKLNLTSIQQIVIQV